jgi:hypothetical protein
VRPVPGSFSWVPARLAEMTDEADVAEITGEGAASWVGTRDGQVRGLKYQIELKKGELIEVLGARKMSLTQDEAEEICYKIAPPPGEFRWIQSKYVTRRGADELAEEPSRPAELPAAKPAGGEIKLVAHETAASSEPSEAGLHSVLKSDGFVPRKKGASRPDVPAAAPTSAPSPEATPAAAPSDVSKTEESVFDVKLHELDAELSLTVARDPSTWNLAPLRGKAAALMDSGQTALDRGRARVLVEKIDEFADFARRRPIGAASTAAISAAVSTSSAGPPSATKTEPTPAKKEPKSKTLIDPTARAIGSGVKGSAFAPDVDPRYDGMGWLMQVHSENGSTPSYALMDNQGKVLQYVTPAPGLNLHRYLRTQVGIYGQKGYNTRLLMPQLTAQKVVSLERHRR